eukprot:CAMPEP_0167812318 /NCGR_PEP_ID=MMETSP0112_2-20121227/1185_1 /TAXON_ID=91324 /ORGANISM="Lotharella globosa, Strain CCCM811" /LENGTH=879 /DNA_ID=CAMNT_0007711183 /DNA_START=29 /DNA_END=2665 /DNA_ORIENTATION=-
MQRRNHPEGASAAAMTGGFKSAYKTQEEREADIAAAQQKQTMISMRERIKELQWKLTALQENYQGEVKKTFEMEEEVKLLTEDLQLLRANVTGINLKKQEQPMRIKLQSLEAQLDLQRHTEREALRAVDEAEGEVEATEFDLYKLTDDEPNIDAHLKAREEEAQMLSKTRKDMRDAAADRRDSLRHKAHRQQTLNFRKMQEKLFNYDEDARAHHKKIRDRLRKSLKAAAESAKAKDLAREELMRKRAEAVLQLKASTEAARSKIISEQERRRKREARAMRAREKERALLAKTTRNPEAVFRARDAMGETANTGQMIKNRIVAQNLALIHKIADEEKRERAAKGIADYEKYQADRYYASIHPNARQAAVSKYMQSRTRNGGELLDVQGKDGPLRASRVTRMTRKDFGLGRAHPETLERERRKMPKVRYKEEDLSIPQIEKQPGFGRTMEVPPDRSDGDEDEVKRPETRDTTRPTTAVARLDFGGAGVAPSNGGRPEFKAPVVGEYMEAKLKQAREERERALRKGGEKKILGKVYKGRKFLCQPEVVEFNDFLVGETETRKLVITNVSFTFNSYRVEGIELKNRDVLELKYKPPGRMSAGLTASIEIIFSPAVNKDINTFLALATETGPLQIPIRCRTRKVDVVLPSPVLSLGSLPCGETMRRTVEIVNSGALPIDFHVTHNHGETEGELSYEQAKDAIQFRGGGRGTVGGYSKTRIGVTFKPVVAGQFDMVAMVEFGKEIKVDDRNFPIEWGSSKSYPLRIMGESCLVPVYIENPVMDFQRCIVDKLYRASLIFRNRSNVAQKISLRAPKPLSHFLEFTPKDGYVQAGVPLVVSVVFNPSREMDEKLKNADYFDVDTRTLDAKLRATCPGQTLPVYFRVK